MACLLQSVAESGFDCVWRCHNYMTDELEVVRNSLKSTYIKNTSHQVDMIYMFALHISREDTSSSD